MELRRLQLDPGVRRRHHEDPLRRKRHAHRKSSRLRQQQELRGQRGQHEKRQRETGHVAHGRQLPGQLRRSRRSLEGQEHLPDGGWCRRETGQGHFGRNGLGAKGGLHSVHRRFRPIGRQDKESRRDFETVQRQFIQFIFRFSFRALVPVATREIR